jgi:hypothetical protein
MLDEYPAVGWYQVVQTERNRFRLRAAPAPNRSFEVDDLRKVIDSGLSRFGLTELIQIDITKDEHIAPDNHSGKLKRITSEIDEHKS